MPEPRIIPKWVPISDKYAQDAREKEDLRRIEYRHAIEENKLLSEKLHVSNDASMENAIDFLWACNFGGVSPPNEALLHEVHDEMSEDPGHSIATLTLNLYRRTLAHTSYSNKNKRKLLDNRLVWVLCEALKPGLPSELPELRVNETLDGQWDELWDITPFANHPGRWIPMASHYSTTHMGQWIMECERCIFANKAPPSAVETSATRRGRAVAVVEVLYNVHRYVAYTYDSYDLRKRLEEIFLDKMPQTLWESAFPGCPRNEIPTQTTLAKNMDLVLASLGFIGDKTFEDAFKKWYLSDINPSADSSRSSSPTPMIPDDTALGMFPEGCIKRSHDFTPSNLDAWFINSGRFKLRSTQDLKQHLRLDQSIRTVYVYIGSNTFENGRLALLHNTRIGSVFSLDRLWDELQMTYSLLFGQTVRGKKIGREMIASANPEYQRIPPMPEKFRERKVLTRTGYSVYKATPDSDFMFFDWGAETRMPRATACPPVPGDFRFFGRRLELLHKQMLADQPRGYLDVLRPGYTDRFTWYTQMFALFIAFLGILNLVLSICQTVYTGVSYRDSIRLAEQANNLSFQQLNVSILALNVSLQQLLLQKVQMNLTTL